MRIAIYHNLLAGGAKRALFEMTSRLAAHHKIDIFAPTSADDNFFSLRPYAASTFNASFKPLPEFRSPLGRLNPLVRILNARLLDTVDRSLARQIDAKEYDVVFVHPCQYRQSPSILRFLRTPSVYYFQEPPRLIYDPPVDRPYMRKHGYAALLNKVDPAILIYNRFLRENDRKSLLAASLVLSNSYFTRELAYRFYGVNAVTCYLGVDFNRFHLVPYARKCRVISVGEMAPRKGFDFLIQALGMIPLADRPRLTLISNGGIPEEQSFLTEQARKLNVQVEFRSMVPDDELIYMYSESIVTLYAPILEPFGLVPLESMACEAPVIGVAEGGVREIIVDGWNGFLCDRNPNQMARKLERLLKNPGEASELGQHGLQQVKTMWSWENTLSALQVHLCNTANGGNK